MFEKCTLALLRVTDINLGATVLLILCKNGSPVLVVFYFILLMTFWVGVWEGLGGPPLQLWSICQLGPQSPGASWARCPRGSPIWLHRRLTGGWELGWVSLPGSARGASPPSMVLGVAGPPPYCPISPKKSISKKWGRRHDLL